MSLRINTTSRRSTPTASSRTPATSSRSRWSASSSGYRINRAADDAAGLAISEKLRGSDQRPRPGPAQRAGRDLAGADGRRLAERGALDAPARPRARRAVQERHALGRRQGGDPVRGRPARPPRSSASAPTAQFNGITLLSGAGTITFQVGANDGETISVSTHPLGARPRHGRLAICAAGSTRHRRRSTPRSTTSPPAARPSARCRTASSTR